jgi:regulator of cell morphogenesis and NO signaling
MGMKQIESAAIVNDVLRRYPSTVGVFNAFGIDACCGGALSLAEAAQRDGADLTALLDALHRAVQEAA